MWTVGLELILWCGAEGRTDGRKDGKSSRLGRKFWSGAGSSPRTACEHPSRPAFYRSVGISRKTSSGLLRSSSLYFLGEKWTEIE